MVKVAAIADDLTGANDTALQFAKRCIRASVCLGGAALSGAPESAALVVDADSRGLCADAAYERVRGICRALSRYGAPCFYKKIDSTLRGNPGAEIRAMDDELAPALVVIAPAYPVQRRLTIGGYHLLDGLPLELTELSRAPKTPVRDSFIPDVLRRDAPDAAIGALGYRVVRGGAAEVGAAIDALLREGRRWLVCDIAADADFIALTEALRGRGTILWAGSAGLADHIPRFYGWRGGAAARQEVREGPVLLCVGSVSHTTQRQLRVVRGETDAAVWKLTAEEVLADGARADGAAAQVARLLAEGRDVVLTAAQDDDDVARAVCAGERRRMSCAEVSERMAGAMAAVVSRLDLSRLSGMALTGGDTAVHVCAALGVDQIEVLREIEPGIPLGRIHTDTAGAVPVVTKAGAFGSPEALVKAIRAIRQGI